MPFAIMLMPADLGAPLPHYKTAIERAVHANGGELDPHGVVRLADGGQFAFKIDYFWPKRLTSGVCRVVFDTALHTNTYVTTGGSDVAPLKVKGTTLNIPSELGPAVAAANPDVLCAKLQGRLARWIKEMGQLRREGVIDADDQPLEPPPDPDTEPRLHGRLPGTAAKCEASEREEASKLGWKFVRSIVTRNAQWGVVWRADIAPESDPATWFRESCWRAPGIRGERGISTSIRPLTMFDKTQSIAPLPTE